MLNLLPQQNKAEIQKEYTLRKIVMTLVLLFVVLVASLLLLAPSYLLSKIREREATDQLTYTKDLLEQKFESENITKEMASAISYAQALRPFKKGTSPYEIIRIFENKPSSIKITQISYTAAMIAGDSPMPASISLEGKAENRESLTAFGKLIEGRSEFSAVNIPVSNFVKERDITFSMTVTLK
jgi:hypothetical protein